VGIALLLRYIFPSPFHTGFWDILQMSIPHGRFNIHGKRLSSCQVKTQLIKGVFLTTNNCNFITRTHSGHFSPLDDRPLSPKMYNECLSSTKPIITQRCIRNQSTQPLDLSYSKQLMDQLPLAEIVLISAKSKDSAFMSYFLLHEQYLVHELHKSRRETCSYA
jgi:hypothetical protein